MFKYVRPFCRHQAMRSYYITCSNLSISTYFFQVSNIWLQILRFAKKKQPPEVFLIFFCRIHRKTPVLESLLRKVVGLTECNFIKKRLQHRCFAVNIANWIFQRIPISKNVCKLIEYLFCKRSYKIFCEKKFSLIQI